ncbi:MAG: 30S ribosomal protein S19 [Candidatus Diapherotrites archaeon]|uniref:Small ribosomal subunit protein uS19 n=1 Tax=Candidatus Iainarchaeum sp. TaxID=3101447 RepID=A0A2D6M0Q4_9ARCH|nr:30S ribosomal protein S19 [Candidatus Diapherotrites archaeon]|tara:strand:- start:958 stop:1362 length:405 start_codon:yes stop_codon:yes gene_type:complete
MVKKEFTYRGKTLPELEAMELNEFAALATSSARRGITRGLDKKLLKKVQKAKDELKQGKNPKVIRTHQRGIIIIPAMVGVRIAVHRGNSFETIEVKPEMLGHRLGEMVMTRKKLMHGKAGIGATRSSTAITARK